MWMDEVDMHFKEAAIYLAVLLVSMMNSSHAASAGKLAITNTNLFDSITGTMLSNRTIIVEGDRISAIGTPDNQVEIPANAKVIKGKDKYVIPGLIDAHVHLAFLLDEVGISGESVLPLYLGNGVTSIRGVGDAILPAKAVADYASNHPDTCPRVFICGPLIDGDPPFHPTCAQAITDPAQVPAFVDQMVSYGVSTLKLYVKVSPEVFAKVCEEAHKHGLTAAAHLGSITTQQAVDYGIDTIEHIWGAPTNPAVMADMVSHGVMLDPTLVVFRNMIYLCDLPEVYTDPTNLYAPKVLQDSWDKHRLNSGNNQSNRADRITLVDSYKQLTGQLYRAGVTLLAGTDSAEPYCLPGVALHTELELLTQSGIPPAAVLQCATINNARALKQQANIGSIEAGKIADIVILSGNPLSDIRNTRKIRWVIHNGILSEPKKILPKPRKPLKLKTCDVSGVVTYAGDVMDGVKVATADGSAQTITDSNGKYEIQSVLTDVSNAVIITVDKQGFYKENKVRSVHAKQGLVINFDLSPLPKNNLLKNPSFEEGVPYSVFTNASSANWTGSVSNGNYFCQETALRALTLMYSHTGTEAASTALAKGHNSGSAELFQEAPVFGNTQYTASVWVKGANYSGNKTGFGSISEDSAGLRISEYDSDGKLLCQHETVINHPTKDYTRIAVAFMSKPNTIRMRFSIFGNLHTDEYKGRVTFDDCVLERVESSASNTSLPD